MLITITLLLGFCLVGGALENGICDPSECDDCTGPDIYSGNTPVSCGSDQVSTYTSDYIYPNGGLSEPNGSGTYQLCCGPKCYGDQLQLDEPITMAKRAIYGDLFSCTGTAVMRSGNDFQVIPSVGFTDKPCSVDLFDRLDHHGQSGTCYCLTGDYSARTEDEEQSGPMGIIGSLTRYPRECSSMLNVGTQVNVSDLLLNCSSDRCNSICPSSGCSGDSLYCTVYDCEESSPCYCNLISIVQSRSPQPELRPLRVRDRHQTFYLPVDPPCSLTIVGSESITICDDEQLVEIRVLDTIIQNMTIGRVSRSKLPEIRQVTTVRCYSLTSNGSVFQDSALYEPVWSQSRHCPAACWLCEDAWNDFSCMSTYDKAMSVMLAIIVAILALTSIGWILAVLFFSCNVAGCMGGHMWSCCVKGVSTSREAWRGASDRVQMLKKQTEPQPRPRLDGVKIDSDEESPLVSTSARQDTATPIASQYARWRVKKPSMVRAATVGAALSAYGSDAACSTGMALTGSTIANCVNTVYNVSCHETSQSLANIPTTGTSACLSFNTSSGEPVQTMDIAYDDLEARYPLVSMFFTSGWGGHSFSDKTCWTPSNWCGGLCDAADPADPFGHGHITGVVTNLPGVSGCYRSCGCAGCGCTYCSSACVAYRWAVEPVGEVCEVFTTGTPEFRPTLTMTMGDQTHTSIITSATQELLPGSGVTVVSTNWPPAPVISPYSVMRCPSGDYFVQACAAGSPQVGCIGDIQGPTAISLASPTFDSFSVAALATPQFLQSSVAHNFVASAFLNNPRFALPYVINGVMWSIVDGYLSSHIASPFGLLISLVTTNMLVSRTYDSVCPEVTFRNASGCFACANNASTATFDIRSTCLNGSCTVSTTDPHLSIITTVVQATTESQVVSIAFLSSVAGVSSDFLFHCSGSDATAEVVATLLPYSLWHPSGNATTGNRTATSSDDGLSFGDFAFKSPLASFLSILTIMFIIFCAGVLAMILWRLVPIVKAKTI